MAQFHLHVVEVFLAAVVEDDQARRKADRLPAQLGTDRSPGAGDEDDRADRGQRTVEDLLDIGA